MACAETRSVVCGVLVVDVHNWAYRYSSRRHTPRARCQCPEDISIGERSIKGDARLGGEWRKIWWPFVTRRRAPD
jgi:hypothetical protein